jgi:hypothetical protein
MDNTLAIHDCMCSWTDIDCWHMDSSMQYLSNMHNRNHYRRIDLDRIDHWAFEQLPARRNMTLNNAHVYEYHNWLLTAESCIRIIHITTSIDAHAKLISRIGALTVWWTTVAIHNLTTIAMFICKTVTTTEVIDENRWKNNSRHNHTDGDSQWNHNTMRIHRFFFFVYTAKYYSRWTELNDAIYHSNNDGWNNRNLLIDCSLSSQ